MGIFGTLSNLGVTARQQQRAWIAHLWLDKSEITCRVEQTRVPAFPVRQQGLDLIAKAHARNVTEHHTRDNAFGKTDLFYEHARADQSGSKQHGSENHHLTKRRAEDYGLHLR